VNANEISRREELTIPTFSVQRQGGGADGAVPPSLPRGNKPHATLPQQEKNVKEMRRKAELTLPALSAQRQGAPRGHVLLK
jgi:hypothetical protein